MGYIYSCSEHADYDERCDLCKLAYTMNGPSMAVRKMIPYEELNNAFKNTTFGGSSEENLVLDGLLKFMAGYSCGSTLTQILQELGLLTQKRNISKKGRLLLFNAFHTQVKD